MNVTRELAQNTLIAPRPPEVHDRREGRDRRASPRVAVEVDCEELVDGTRSFRVTRDLSLFGLSTRFGYPHRLGTRFDMVLYLPDDRANPIRVQTEVVGWNEGGAGMRLAFRNPTVEALRRIQRYLRRRSGAEVA